MGTLAPADRVEQLVARLTELEHRVNTPARVEVLHVPPGLESRVSAAESDLTVLAQTSSLAYGELEARVQALGGRLVALQHAVRPADEDDDDEEEEEEVEEDDDGDDKENVGNGGSRGGGGGAGQRRGGAVNSSDSTTALGAADEASPGSSHTRPIYPPVPAQVATPAEGGEEEGVGGRGTESRRGRGTAEGGRASAPVEGTGTPQRRSTRRFRSRSRDPLSPPIRTMTLPDDDEEEDEDDSSPSQP